MIKKCAFCRAKVRINYTHGKKSKPTIKVLHNRGCRHDGTDFYKGFRHCNCVACRIERQREAHKMEKEFRLGKARK